MTFGLFVLVVNATKVGLAAWIVPVFDIDRIISSVCPSDRAWILSTGIRFIAYSILRPEA